MWLWPGRWTAMLLYPMINLTPILESSARVKAVSGRLSVHSIAQSLICMGHTCYSITNYNYCAEFTREVFMRQQFNEILVLLTSILVTPLMAQMLLSPRYIISFEMPLVQYPSSKGKPKLMSRKLAVYDSAGYGKGCNKEPGYSRETRLLHEAQAHVIV